MCCCNVDKNLLPVLYNYTNKNNVEMVGVSHFVCTCCFSTVTCDDSYDVYKEGERMLVEELSRIYYKEF